MTRTAPRLAAILLLTAASARAAAPADEPALPYTPSLDVTAMDRSVDPCADLYRYSCGGWQKKNPIPADQTAWDVYRKLSEDNLTFLRAVLEQAASAKERDAVTARIGDYYAACMDEAAADRLGTAPIRADLDAIAAAGSTRELSALLARLQRESEGRGILFAAGSQQDPDDSETQIASFDQGGLGLPDRDYYFKTDDKSKDNRERYVAHVAKVLELLDDAPADARRSAAQIMRLETALAGASLTKVERRDPYKLKHKMKPADLETLAPALAWKEYLAQLQAPPFDTVNVTAPAFFTEVSRRLGSEPLSVWKDYLRFHLANGRAPVLSAPFVNEDFEFYRKYLKGAKEIQPRWKRCVELVDSQLGEALGQAFVRKVFTPPTKEAALAMVRGIEAVMERRLKAREWMGPETKKAALDKLRAVRNKIGYPDRWRDYSSVRVERTDAAGNVARAAAFEFRRQLGKIGRPVDHGEWGMTPPTVNAYFDAQMNDINFPAGVLQPPLYDPKMDDAPNYGNTGGTIGHELTHGFDDEGHQYDAHGNLKDWWTKADAAQFAERAKCVSDQYGSYVAVDDIHVNSALSLGEDIADLGGEILAYEAWQDAVKGKALSPNDGLTPEQRFFVGFAQWACENARPEQQREWALTNPHSPARYRINGVVVNMPEFARAFACPAGAPMTKPAGKACSIW
ncbi:MAG: M13 family metallopeptidase [Elusimicrobia bacterium]|nr:M13 family metallopeptidase [Elusimicrobiota bacterium]